MIRFFGGSGCPRLPARVNVTVTASGAHRPGRDVHLSSSVALLELSSFALLSSFAAAWQ